VERAPAEKITGVAAYISFGDPGPAIQAFDGKTGRDSRDPPVRQNTLFQMGSTSKSFTAAVILKLEAAGKLSLDGSVTATVARCGLPGKMANDDLVCPPPVSARDHPARRLALCGCCHANDSVHPFGG
jgi:hypothetical protein